MRPFRQSFPRLAAALRGERLGRFDRPDSPAGGKNLPGLFIDLTFAPLLYCAGASARVAVFAGGQDGAPGLRIIRETEGRAIAKLLADIEHDRIGLPGVQSPLESALGEERLVAPCTLRRLPAAEKQRTQMTLLSIHSAERQTVQGALYRLCLLAEIEDTEHNVIVEQGVRAQVYQNLKGQFSLSKWTEENCNEEEEEEEEQQQQ